MRLSMMKSAIRMRDEGDDDQRDEEDDGSRTDDRDAVIVRVSLRVGQQIRVEEVGGSGRADPARDRQDFAREAAHHCQHGGEERDADDNTVEKS